MEVILTTGFYDDGIPGEIFVTASKSGSTIQGLCDSLARMTSFALQAGVSPEDVAAALTGLRYPPHGITGNPNVPTAESVSDLIGKHLLTQTQPTKENQHG